MTVVHAALLGAAAAYAGFQWTIRVVVYPQMAQVPTDQFARYEASHQQRTSVAVGPLFAALALTSVAALWQHPGGREVACGVLFLLLLALTAFGAVPQHNRLARGFDPRAYRRLLAVDTVRLVVSLTDLVVAATWV